MCQSYGPIPGLINRTAMNNGTENARRTVGVTEESHPRKSEIRTHDAIISLFTQCVTLAVYTSISGMRRIHLESTAKCCLNAHASKRRHRLEIRGFHRIFEKRNASGVPTRTFEKSIVFPK